MPARRSRPAADGVRLAGLRILLAEDNPVNQAVIEHLLIAEGAVVRVVENGAKAIERVCTDGCSSYDLVLMDLQMPEMGGFEATQRILRLAPDLPIVAQTAHALPHVKDKCIAVGMVDQLVKPIDPEQLVRIVQQHARAAAAP